MRWREAGRLNDLPEGRGRRVGIGGEDIALWKVDGRVYAIGNVCPHQHTALMYQAERSGVIVTCPMHGWSFSLETGRAHEGSGSIRTYRVKVEEGKVLVECPDETA